MGVELRDWTHVSKSDLFTLRTCPPLISSLSLVATTFGNSGNSLLARLMMSFEHLYDTDNEVVSMGNEDLWSKNSKTFE